MKHLICLVALAFSCAGLCVERIYLDEKGPGACREHSDGRGYTFEYAMEWIAVGMTPLKPGESRPNNWNVHFSNVGE